MMDVLAKDFGKGTQGRLGGYLWPVLFLLVDYLAVIVTEVEAYGVHFATSGERLPLFGSYVFLWIPLIFVLFLGSTKVYTHMQPIIETIREVFHAVGFGFVTSLLVLYFFRPELLVSRLSVVAFGVFALGNQNWEGYCVKRRWMSSLSCGMSSVAT